MGLREAGDRMSIAQARADIVAKIQADGWAVTDDPRDLQPPCVIVGLPGAITATGACLYEAELTVTAVAPGPGNADAVTWLLDTTEQLMALLNADRATPTSFTVTKQRVPGYAIAVHVTG